MVKAVNRSTDKSKTKRRIKRQIPDGIVHINATFNNTMISITDGKGNALVQNSASKCGFSGSRKSTPFAASQAAEQVAKLAKEMFGMENFSVRTKGPGQWEAAIRGLILAGAKIQQITNVTGIPHNGCRPRKKRRV